jgi:hypothetical protein
MLSARPGGKWPSTGNVQSLSLLSINLVLLGPPDPAISLQWFPEKQRTVANAIITLANILGTMLAFITMPFVVATPEELPIALLYISIPRHVFHRESVGSMPPPQF